MAQKTLNVGASEIARVTQLVKAYVAPYPEDVRFFGTQTVMTIADSLAQLVEQTRRAQRGAGPDLRNWLMLDMRTVCAPIMQVCQGVTAQRA